MRTPNEIEGYAVSEIFKTIQGEATYTGTPSVFIRLQYCDVGCPWCDTKYTWRLDQEQEVKQLTNEQGYYRVYTRDALLEKILLFIELEDMHNPHIVFTGGEPCAYDLTEITEVLHKQGFTTQIETSGTYEIRTHPSTFVTVSPKYNMPGGRMVMRSSYDRANEIKMPIGKQDDIIRLLDTLSRVDTSGKAIWLQPLSRSEKATQLCIEASLQYGFKLSIQTHHLIGLP